MSVHHHSHTRLTQLAVAESLLFHLALQGTHLLQSALLVLHVLSQPLELLLLGGLLLLPLLLLLQVAQALLLVEGRVEALVPSLVG